MIVRDFSEAFERFGAISVRPKYLEAYSSSSIIEFSPLNTSCCNENKSARRARDGQKFSQYVFTLYNFRIYFLEHEFFSPPLGRA